MRKRKMPNSLPRPIDVLLATNMISVGVDVRRLGLMIVSGQPKTTAEYIQATSRVGRRWPGLICTLYNWARPRDFSHYERFEHYHASFYRHVEALSVTPFSSGAIHRGLTAQLVSLVRLSDLSLNANQDAENLRSSEEFVLAAVEAICQRAEQIKGKKEDRNESLSILKRRLDQWAKIAEQSRKAGSRLGYKGKGGQTAPLLRKPGLEQWQDFTCLNALREVEPNCNLVLYQDWQFGEPMTEIRVAEQVPEGEGR